MACEDQMPDREGATSRRITVSMMAHDRMGVVEIPVYHPTFPRLHVWDPNNSGKCVHCHVQILPGSTTPYCSSPYSELPA